MGFSRFRPCIELYIVNFLTMRSCSLIVLLFLLAANGAARADDEVDCSSLRLSITEATYDSTCELYTGPNDVFEVLEANSTDGSHFLVVIDNVANYQYVFMGGGTLQSSLKGYFTKLTIDKWRSGSVRNGFKTGEFVSDFKTIASDCVAFERYLRKDRGGWRRRIIGFGCSRTGDREQVYQAMDQVNFPE
jgi:hypothetical protein